MSRKDRPARFGELSPEALPVSPESKASLASPKPIRQGVCWSPIYRCWRAYLHVGQKQVFHGLYDGYQEACSARHQAEVRFGRMGDVVGKQIRAGQKPDYRVRWHRAPKPGDRRKELRRLQLLFREAAETLDRQVDRRTILSEPDRQHVGQVIGGMLALIEWLTLTGDVLTADVRGAMFREAKRLAGEVKEDGESLTRRHGE